MSSYKISFKKSAIKELHKLPKKEVIRITELILGLSNNPRPSGCKKLKGIPIIGVFGQEITG